MKDFCRWLNPKAISNQSNIEGRGIFAIDKINKGELVMVYGGKILHNNQILDYNKSNGHIGIQIKEDFFIVPLSKEEYQATGIVNHSCDPNVGFADSITLIAIKDIKPKEEICFDYSFCESKMDSFVCNCSSNNCREIITKDDWKKTSIRNNYEKYYSPYLKSHK